MNAFHWWWLKVDAGSALIVDGVVSPQGYGFGHFSKFVRPGYVRVMAVADEPVAEVLTSAYWERDESTLAIVAINQGDAEVTQSFLLKGLTPIRVTPWLTSSDTTLREQARLRAQNPLSVTLPGQSITTLVVLAEADTLGAGGASGASAGGAAGAASVEAGPGSNTSSTGSDAGTPNGSGGASISASGSTASAADATTSGNTSTGSKDEKVPSLGKGPHAACLCSAPGQPVNHTPWPLLLLVWPVLRWRRRTHHAAG
jgi:glucuronoarabinoxylan endo-1,4-beta-xylanase